MHPDIVGFLFKGGERMFVWIALAGQTEAGEQVSCGCVVFLSVWVK